MKKILFFVLTLFLLVFLTAQSSYFGKNKVNYKINNWQYLQTEHFDIYYYQGGEMLASFASIAAESSIVKLQEEFKYKLKKRVPLIIYNSHKDFEETNITYEILEEFIGGFTESLKNRVVIPFEGSYEDFRHVINHELVHSLQFNFLYGGGLGSFMSSVMLDIPLWFIEGSAEFYSREWDNETDMYMRDAVINDRIIDIKSLSYYYGGYILYKQGQAIHKYIADVYGREKIVEIYRAIKNTKSFRKATISVLGIDLDRLDKDFKFYLKKRYAHVLIEKKYKIENSQSIMGNFLITSPYNVSPSISPDGNYVAFISEKHGFFDIYVTPMNDIKRRYKILPRTLTRHFESFHLKHGKLRWSNDGRYLLFTARTGNKEFIYVYDIIKRKQFKKIHINADAVFSPSMDFSLNKIVFTSVKNSQSDIAVYYIDEKRVEYLTNDMFDDIHPYFLNDSIILFSSSRKDDVWNYNFYDVFKYNLADKTFENITDGEFGSIKDFSVVNDSTIVFVSYLKDIANVYYLNVYTKEKKQLTDVMTGVFSPSMSKNENQLVVQHFNESKMDIVLIRNPLKNIVEIEEETLHDDYVEIFYQYEMDEIKGKNPPLRFTFDWASGAFSYSPGFGFFGLLYASLSDIMGDNRLYVSMEKLSFSGNGYAIIEYWHLKRRINYALQYINFQEEYWFSNYESITETYNGGSILLSYPFNRYSKVDLSSYLFQIKYFYNVYYTDFMIRELLLQGYSNQYALSYVYDNTVWGFFGPVNGEAAKFTIGVDLNPENYFNGNGEIYRYSYFSNDMRKYFVVTSRSQIAVKIAGASVFGENSPNVYIGGTGTVRGYEYRQFYGKNAYYSNIEWRFPLIDRIQFPIEGLALGSIRGIVFTDMGFAKDDLTKLNFFYGDMLDDLKLGFGAGIRMYVWIALLKLDVAKHTDLTIISPNTYWHLSFGAEF